MTSKLKNVLREICGKTQIEVPDSSHPHGDDSVDELALPTHGNSTKRHFKNLPLKKLRHCQRVTQSVSDTASE
jgi:hypothetical protein